MVFKGGHPSSEYDSHIHTIQSYQIHLKSGIIPSPPTNQLCLQPIEEKKLIRRRERVRRL